MAADGGAGYRTVLVGTDGSETAGRAVARAVALAKASGARLLVVSVHEPISTSTLQRELQQVPEELRYRVDLEREARECVEAAGARAAEQGVEVETRALEGEPADVLVSLAEQHDVDLIVVGNKGMIGSRRFLLGSVPNKVTHHAPCDVLVVKTT